jgi:hypothetical protein
MGKMNSDRMKQLIRFAARHFNAPPADIPRDEMWTRIRLERDFSRLIQTSPRAGVWDRIMMLRNSAVMRLRGRSGGGGDNRAGPRGRRGWMLIPAGLTAASVLLGVIQLGPHGVLPMPRGDSAPLTVALDDTDRTGTFAFGGLFGNDVRGSSSFVSSAADGWVDADDPVSEAYRRAAVTHLKRSDALLTIFRVLGTDIASDRRAMRSARELLSTTRLLLTSPVGAREVYKGVFQDLELVLVRLTLVTPATVAVDRRQIERTLERRRLIPRMRELMPTPSAANAN